MKVYVTCSLAWAPGLASAEDWSAWAVDAAPIDSDDKPAAQAVPAITRRRLTRWGRQALEVALNLETTPSIDAPVIFSSRHGDTERTLRLLEALAAGEPLSPNGFSLSVHNAALGIYTILAGVRAPSIALAAGRDTLAEAWIEAESWLATGAPEVLLVHTDEPLADFYRSDADEAELPAALALLLSAEPQRGAVPVTLTRQASSSSHLTRSMAWEFLAWWFGTGDSLHLPTERSSWSWRRESVLA